LLYGRRRLLLLLVLLAVISLNCIGAALRHLNRVAETQSPGSKGDIKLPLKEEAAENRSAAWRDTVEFRAPHDAEVRKRATRAADWLKDHLVVIPHQDNNCEIRVIAWKDPTLEPANPDLLAGYLITDTLWAAKALRFFDSAIADEVETSLQCLGWYGNGLHDVLFHPLERILHRPADDDFVHGSSLGRFPVANGKTIDVRVMRQKWDADFNVGHPLLFAEHAVYQALFDYWQGRIKQARERVLKVVADHRTTDSKDRIFWDDEARILVDFVTIEDWLAFQKGTRPDCRHCTFKLGLLLYAIRVLDLEHELASLLPGMRQRLWEAQHDRGGLAHFLDVQKDGTFDRGIGSTGEASAIAILSEVVTVHRGHERDE
jgi:hypothetical protein